jgi:DNA polymerase III epsilon subunit-like protein
MANKEVYISVDIEASGPVPPAFSLLALGAVVVGEPKKSFYAELKPIGTQAVPEAMNVIGKALEYFSSRGRDPKEVIEEFTAWISEVSHGGKPVFVGFNAAFDWAFVNWYFHEYVGRNPFGIAPLDIKAYYMGLSGCAWEETRSSKIPNRFKGPTQQTHNALDDAKSQAEMFERMQHRRAP